MEGFKLSHLLLSVVVLLSGGMVGARGSTLVYENWDANGIGLRYTPYAGVLVADDISPAGTQRELVNYDFTVFAPGGSTPYQVTSELYTDSNGLPGLPIAGTLCAHTVTVPDQVTLDCTAAPGVILPELVWMVLEFDSDDAGWVVAEVAELGFTDDVFAEYDGFLWNPYWFGGPPEPYAGFAANLWCAESCARGDYINPGSNYWTCPHADFVFGGGGGGGGCIPPAPADFFGPGSDPFEGQVACKGDDPVSDAKTERTSQGHVPPPYPSSDLIDIELVELSLRSVAPITVTYNGGMDPELWEVEVDLSAISPHSGTLNATKTHCNGGTYMSNLPVQPRFTFTKVDDPVQVRVLDTGLEGLAAIDLNSVGPCEWEHTADGNDFRPSAECPLTLADVEGCSMTLIAAAKMTDSFWVRVGPDGVAQGGGSGYNDGQWYYYPNTDWWNEWFYDHPFDPQRKKIIDVSFMIQPLDPGLPSWATVAYNWSAPDWPDPCNPPLPPLDPVEEGLYIERSIFFEDDLAVWPQFIEDHFEIDEYNPEWISIDVNGFNFEIIDGWIDHACIPKTDLDFGDAPDPCYPTLLASDGARHIIGGPYFCDPAGGDAPDPEPDGQPDAAATGDDNNADDDEDGVRFPVLVPGEPGLVDVDVCGGGGIVEIWIDYNGDGDWDDPCEFEFSGLMGDGPNTIVVNPPAGSVIGVTFARCRISSAGVGLPTGQADDGEVEDHMVEIEPQPTCWDNANECGGQDNGDANCDGGMNFIDLGLLKVAFFSTKGQPNYNCCADFNHDEAVNFLDLGILKSFCFFCGGFTPATGNQNCPP
jgi:hypothetical protein